MKMPNISHSAAQHFDVARAHNLRLVHERYLALEGELADRKPIDALEPFAGKLAVHLQHERKSVEARIERLGASLPALEQAAKHYADARVEADRAQAKVDVGTTDAKEAVRDFHALIAAQSALRVRHAEVDSAAREVSAGLPMRVDVQTPEHVRQVVDKLGAFCRRSIFDPHNARPIEIEFYRRWLEQDESSMAWLPLFADRWLRSECPNAGDALVNRRDDARGDNDRVRDQRDLRDAFIRIISEFVRDRERHLAAKADEARREVERATARVAAMGGAS